jgi:hypothetical protein
VCGYKNVSSKIVELEEELRVVGNNLKSLELSEEKALEREDVCAQQIRELDARLKEVGICPRVHMCPYIYGMCATDSISIQLWFLAHQIQITS